MVYIYNAGERFALREQIKWGLALISLALLLLISIVLILVLKTVTKPLTRASGDSSASVELQSSSKRGIDRSARRLPQATAKPRLTGKAPVLKTTVPAKAGKTKNLSAEEIIPFDDNEDFEDF